MKTLLVTLTLGDESQNMWTDVFSPSWHIYAERNGYDVIQILDPLDKSSDVKPPSWQKLLVLRNPSVAKYDQIIWMDHDMLISPFAPPMEEIEPGKVGVVNWQGSYPQQPSERDPWLREFQSLWQNNACDWIRDAKIENFSDVAALAGYANKHNDWLNAGVIVFDPSSRGFLERIYHNRVDTPHSSKEQQALTYELLSLHRNKLHSLDRRWNCLWPLYMSMHYAFIRVVADTSHVAACSVAAAMGNNYAIHFLSGSTRNHAEAYNAHLARTGDDEMQILPFRQEEA